MQHLAQATINIHTTKHKNNSRPKAKIGYNKKKIAPNNKPSVQKKHKWVKLCNGVTIVYKVRCIKLNMHHTVNIAQVKVNMQTNCATLVHYSL